MYKYAETVLKVRYLTEYAFFAASLIAPNVQIATTSTTAKVSWDGVGADAKLFTIRLRRTDVPDGAELVSFIV